MSYCARSPSTAVGMISGVRANTSCSAGARPRHIWPKSKTWLTEKNPMNATLLRTQWQQLPERAVRQLQADKLRRYLRDVVLPFSAHYRELFQKKGLKADSIRTLEDLEQIPFTSKTDLLNAPENSQKMKSFLLIPEQEILARRATTIMRALLEGREKVKR